MSVKIMGLVWEIDLPSNEKLVLLAYADHAAHDGTGIYPAVALVARKTGYSEREVQRVTRTLQGKGLLIPDGTGPRGTNRWRCAPGGDNLSRVTSDGVTAAIPGGDIDDREGVTPMAPEPSLTIIEPSSRGGLSQTEHDQAKAQVTAMIGNASKAAYLNRDRIPASFLAHADLYHELTGQEPTKRVLHDWLATFSDWAAEGIQPEHVRKAHKESQGRFTVLRPGSLTNMAAACKARERLTIQKPRDDLHETQLLLKQMDRERAGAIPMPQEVRQRLDAFLKDKTLKPEA